MDREIVVDIHGSCVSRDVFRNQNALKVGKYIGRCSIISTQYPKIMDAFYDNSANNSTWEKRMLTIDFSKTIFEELKKSHGDYIMIDLIDEIFELIKIKVGDTESAVTYSQVLRRSDFQEQLHMQEIELINTRRFENSKIIDAIRNYADEIKQIYRPEQIIINEAYPVKFFYDKHGKICEFDQERQMNVKRNFYKLKLYYSLLENELWGCYIIRMPPDIRADELHQWGIATTHFETKFYTNVYEKVLHIISQRESDEQFTRVNIQKSRHNGVQRDNYLGGADITKSNNIVVFGAQDYFKENISKLDTRIRISYIFPDGIYNKELEKEYKIVTSISELKKIQNVFVLIAKGRAADVERIADQLRTAGIPFDHLEMYVKSNINIRYLKAMNYYDYTDIDNNHFIIAPSSSERISISRLNCKNAYVEIGYNAVQTKLVIQLLGNNAYCTIGENGSFVDTVINVNTDGAVEIGDECMFSHSIYLAQSDQHYIFDANSRKRLNYPKKIKIGNHVWVGREVELLGGAEIGDNSIVGARSTTSGKFPKNVIIAGCPAKVIKENIIWARDVQKNSNYNTFDEVTDQSALKYL